MVGEEAPAGSDEFTPLPALWPAPPKLLRPGTSLRMFWMVTAPLASIAERSTVIRFEPTGPEPRMMVPVTSTVSMFDLSFWARASADQRIAAQSAKRLLPRLADRLGLAVTLAESFMFERIRTCRAIPGFGICYSPLLPIGTN